MFSVTPFFLGGGGWKPPDTGGGGAGWVTLGGFPVKSLVWTTAEGGGGLM